MKAAAAGSTGPTTNPVAGNSSAAGSQRMAAGSGGGLVVMGGMGGMLASAGSSAPAAGSGAGGMMGKASNAGAAAGRGNGNVQISFSASNQILRMVTTLEVPDKPTGNTTLFLWPGLEPIQGSPHYSPIGTGVLQPVLTWGGSCAPGSPQTSAGKNWWISSQYVNTLGSESKHKGCYGGPTMDVDTGDQLVIDMSLKGTVWNQAVTSQKSGKKVDFDMDMAMQEQRWALFEIEMPTSTKPSGDVVFTNTVITLEKPEPKACQPTARGANDYFSTPIASADGLKCCIARLVLRAAGVPATTKDP
jgi:hypothetical protein